MSPKPVTKHTTKHNVPIVNVFDEDQTETPSLQPARRPVVVEIENVEPEMPTPTPPSYTAPVPETPTPHAPEPQQPIVQRVWQSQQPVSEPQPQMAPVMPIQPQVQAAPEVSNIAPFVLAPQPEVAPVMQPQAPVAAGMSAEPTLPSFFEHDLKNGMNQPVQQMQTQPLQPGIPQGAPNMFADASAVAPQAVVGEINEAASEGGNNKKLIGIILMVLAVLILAIGGLFLYARNLFSPTSVPTPTPEVVATPRPTPVSTTAPVASESATLNASESALLKKKVKVDVLNGTKISGLATKEAALLKAAGFTTGTVGNGNADLAGTISYPAAYKALIPEIKSTLKDLTFTASESAKATSIVVTLGK